MSIDDEGIDPSELPERLVPLEPGVDVVDVRADRLQVDSREDAPDGVSAWTGPSHPPHQKADPLCCSRASSEPRRASIISTTLLNTADVGIRGRLRPSLTRQMSRSS